MCFDPKMCSDHYGLLVITLSKIVKSRWFWYIRLNSMSSFEWTIICIFEFFTPKNELTPLLSFSTFRDLYLGPELRPKRNFDVIRLNSTSSFEWHINCPDWNLGPMNKFYRNLLLTIMSCNSTQHFFRGLVLVSFDSAQWALLNDI